MDCIKDLNSYAEIAALVTSVQERRIYDYSIWEKYRGQGRPEYTLTPTIARGLHTAGEVRDREQLVLDAFQQELRKRKLEHTIRVDPNLSNEQNKWTLAVQAQHLTIPTRLLDWTIHWKVALWFAVEEAKNDAVDGQFWIFSVPHVINYNDTHPSFLQLDFTNLPQTIYMNPAIHWSDQLNEQVGEIKRFRQHGQFSISPYTNAFIPLEDHPNVGSRIEKYRIPAAIKAQLRAQLDAEGTNRQFMYYEEKQHTELDALVQDIRSL